jgi:hypothetical protein
MKTGPDALGIAPNKAESAKHKNWTQALAIAQNESGSAKHENMTQRTRFRRKLVRKRKTCKRDPTSLVPLKMSPGTQNMKTEPGALGTVENESSSAKHEN